VFDSVLAIRRATGDTLPDVRGWDLAPGAWEAAYAASLPQSDPLTLTMAERALAAAPNDPVRRGELGLVRFNRNEFREALPDLMAAIRARPDDARYLLPAGLATSAIGDLPGGRALLERSRAAGGDSIYATAVMAEMATGEGDWETAATETERALRGVRPTIAAPFPAALQNAVLNLAVSAPPPLAAPVMELAARTRPSWDMAYRGGALVNVRWGGEHCRQAAVFVTELARFGWTPAEEAALLRPCGARR